MTPEPGTKGPLLPMAAVARRLGVSKKTVARRIRAGELLGGQRVGGKVCLPEAEVLAYLRRERERSLSLVRAA
ncbi:DNA binding domain protein, excisionase family [Anaeromyxobacter dehalogenans 2CP-1]|uniref:DNA binding domain protein, excisionase family n=1 Tax=Anaeromyxobacter dehalogenans (strain ATCC BAA-258 / DSM 21875 / 2CP-1) TaxID=455488 RepID=B8J978_ANAD2|nr:helix-turn-helix domain-containing protein [Anaeromyxobacter dehalogenans]ACL65484.1 DNA binding domain protein, excisionase family [Anaeromyxobacter dehalogenans 2CP-1]